MVAIAKRRGANAILDFQFMSRAREGTNGVGQVAQIMARGRAVVLKRIPSEKDRAWQVRSRRQSDVSVCPYPACTLTRLCAENMLAVETTFEPTIRIFRTCAWT